VYAGQEINYIDKELERRLQAAFPSRRWRVCNFGRSSYVSTQELIVVAREVLPLAVDGLVVLDGFNDVYMPRVEPRAGYPYLFRQLEARVQSGPFELALAGALDGLRRHSAAFSLVAPGQASDGRPVPDDIMERALDEYRRALVEMVVLARAWGVRTLIAPQPWVGDKPTRIAEEEEYFRYETGFDSASRHRRRVEVAREAATAARCDFADLSDLFLHVERQVFHDSVHVHEHGGNELIAERLLDRLRALDVAQWHATGMPR
jgi:hypothetical protein